MSDTPKSENNSFDNKTLNSSKEIHSARLVNTYKLSRRPSLILTATKEKFVCIVAFYRPFLDGFHRNTSQFR